VKLYFAVSKERDYSTIAISFIAFSLISLYNSFAKHHFLTILLTIKFVMMVAFSISESRRYNAEFYNKDGNY
jgi:c-di-AMP phosphodiesterase-like protein